MQTDNLPTDNEILSRFSAYSVDDDSKDDQELAMDIFEINKAEKSAWAVNRSMIQFGDQRQPCVSCHETKEVNEVPCEHLYRRDYVRRGNQVR